MSTILVLFLWFLITATLIIGVAYLSKKHGVSYLIALMAVFSVLANIISGKITSIFGLIVPAGFVIYSLTFLITDILSEYFGKEYAAKAVWAGFISNVFLIITTFIAIYLPPVSFNSEYSQAFAQVMGLTPRIVLASMIAYLVSQNHDVWMFHFIKNKTHKKWLWVRNNLSTALSQAIDTFLFITIAFYGTVPSNALISMITSQYLVKIIIAILDTPFIYLAGKFLRN